MQWADLPRSVLAVTAAVFVASTALWLALDLDGDGLSTVGEWKHGTRSWDGDRDDDGLRDGWETERGLDPRSLDTDQDTVADRAEALQGSDPREPDTDFDGVPDGDEPGLDCDGDGAFAVTDADDDQDGRHDGDEPVVARCDPDADGDAVLDGDEKATACILDTDCDDDGLDDGLEQQNGYDSLDPDSQGTGLGDGVAWAFQEAGQPPSTDGDGDGIPDEWETSTGLIDWDGFAPQPGRQDLLVEFVKVVGPDSGRVLVDLTPAYRAVAQMFADEADVDLQWQETRVALDQEVRPGILAESDLPHYLDVLDRSAYANNPYVTSVILNPQQTQEEFGEILGAAFLRSMVAIIDYGAHTTFTFEPGARDGNWQTSPELFLSPVLESHIQDADVVTSQVMFQDTGINRVYAQSGKVYLRDDGQGLTWSWDLHWFHTAPNVTADDGSWLQFVRTGVSVDTAELASTIAHELGHTLGLCHAHENTCIDDWSYADRLRADTTTMSYHSDPTALHFLDREWDQVTEFLACPPTEPVRLVAEGVDSDVLLDAKYAQAFTEAVDARTCGDFAAVPFEFDPDPAPFVYNAPAGDRTPPAVRGLGWTTPLYFVAAIGASTGSGWLWFRRTAQ